MHARDVCVHLGQQGGDDVQRGLVDGLVLQRRGEGHVHQRPDLLQHHVPAARVVQHLAVLVDLFLQEARHGATTHRKLNRRTGNKQTGSALKVQLGGYCCSFTMDAEKNQEVNTGNNGQLLNRVTSRLL